MNNQQAFLRFKELLETRREAYDAKRDIREHVRSLFKKNVGFGYVASGLNSAFGANIRNVFDHAIGADEVNIERADAGILFGTIFQQQEMSHKGGVRLLCALPLSSEILFAEASFLATSHSWAHSFQERNPAYACLGYVYDDIAHYFMADYPNRIIHKLNSAEVPSAQEMARAQNLINRIVCQRISKYNAQPMTAPPMSDGYKRRVLVCDQAYADASTVYGKVGDADFERMLLSAISENPDAEVLVKTHPDSVWSKDNRAGYYAHLKSTGRVRMLREPVNPYVLFEKVDTVYVGTSQMGLEALFAGKKVVTFGAPFYAGWGITDDRQEIPHRYRKRSLEEIFHYFYVWYTIYNVPGKKGAAEIEDVLQYIERNRPYPLLPRVDELSVRPRVSVIIPVYGVEKYVEQCVHSVQRQTLRDLEIIPIIDASPDSSLSIIDRLAAEDSRIRPIILSENVGQGMARNRGLEAARGDYIWLLDGDDWLSDVDMLQKLVEQASQTGVDMLRAPKAFEAVFDESDVLLTQRQDATEDYFHGSVPKTDFVKSPHLLHNRHCWTWLYRRDFLNEMNVRFFTRQWEERAFLIKALVCASSIGISNIKGTAYRVRSNSTARRERTHVDFEMMLVNFQNTFNVLLDHGAASYGHPLRYHLAFQVTQFVQHMILSGPYRYYRGLGQGDLFDFVSKVKSELLRCNFSSSDFVCDVHGLSKSHLVDGAYELIVAAILADRLDILAAAVDLKPVLQRQLYSILLDENAGTCLQQALNRYARNERVLTAASADTIDIAQKPRILIHIGSTKTGSTFIQHVLEKNRAELLRQGIWFPEVGLFWQPTRPHKQAGHAHFTGAAVRHEMDLRQHIECGLQLMNGRIHTIILSSEAFFLQENAFQLVDYFAGYVVEVVVYLRRQDEWANSQYCEFVAGGAVGRVDVPIVEWLEQQATKRQLDYRSNLDKWSSKVGRQNVHVGVFDRASFVNGDLLADFANIAKLPQLLELRRPLGVEYNDARLSAAHVEVIRIFNKRKFPSRDAYFDFIEDVVVGICDWRHKNAKPLDKPWVLEQVRADSLMLEHADGNASIARDYLGRADGLLFGPRGAVPSPSFVYSDEIAIIERIWQRHGIEAEVSDSSAELDLRRRNRELEASVSALSAKLSHAADKKSILNAADQAVLDLEAEMEFVNENLVRVRNAISEIKCSRGYRFATFLRNLRRFLR